MTIYEYFHRTAETMPAWLANFGDADEFPQEDFFGSRVVFYPGSGNDGHAVKVFGSTHAAHCFVYADYTATPEELQMRLDHPVVGFLGYRMAARKELVAPNLLLGDHNPRGSVDPYAFLVVLEREQQLNDQHGPQRLAVLFVGVDAVAAYEAFFCSGRSVPAPFGVLLQDHGFGENYTTFGRGGLLDKVAQRGDRRPEYLLVGANTKPWDGYNRVNVECDRGGMHSNLRCLYRRIG